MPSPANRVCLVLCVAATLLPIGCGGTETESGFDSTVVTLLGPETVAVLQEAERVESFRVDPYFSGEGDEPSLAGYRITAEGPALSGEQTAMLLDLIRDRGSYDFQSAKGCEFMPGVAIRFTSGEEEVVVLLCYSCNEWRFERAGKAAGEDFDPVREQLVALAKALFPADEEIQSL